MRDDERRVLRSLKRKYRQNFKEEELDCGVRADGVPVRKKFDAVSENRDIIAMVKNYSAENLIGNRTRLARVMHDMVLLSEAKAEIRLMYLSKEFREWFETAPDAAVPSGIEIRTIPS
ncbi:MAG: hypothetical protein J4N63_07635 [Chloroflexi bacterium]|nr:hypothetical protein [Chloroflexota bacterium]